MSIVEQGSQKLYLEQVYLTVVIQSILQRTLDHRIANNSEK